MSLLYTKNLRKEFGGVIAVTEVDFSVEKGSITGLIGPNGAGKTTLFNCITGLDTPTEGRVFFKSKDITALPAYQITRRGIARTFQNIRLFKEMTVLENVMIGRHFKGGQLDIPSLRWLDFFGLNQFHNVLSKNLPYGKQRELEITRALATEPELLFLDEPAAGMNPAETKELMASIRKIRDSGVTVVLIEHDMKLVMNACENITVLNFGSKIAEGSPAKILADPLVVEAYLGKSNE